MINVRDDIQQRMAQIRSELHDDVEHVVEQAKELADWRNFLLSAAYAIQSQWALSMPIALLISAGVGAIIAALLLRVGWRKLRTSFHELETSRDEFQRNVQWVKQMLRREPVL